jgi:hypothetical protein
LPAAASDIRADIAEKLFVNDVAEMVGVAADVLVLALVLAAVELELELEPHPATTAALAISATAMNPKGLRLSDVSHRIGPAFNILSPPVVSPSSLNVSPRSYRLICRILCPCLLTDDQPSNERAKRIAGWRDD